MNSVRRIEEADEPLPETELIGAVIQPTIVIAEQCFSAALREINVADLVRQALHVRGHGLHSFDPMRLNSGDSRTGISRRILGSGPAKS